MSSGKARLLWKRGALGVGLTLLAAQVASLVFIALPLPRELLAGTEDTSIRVTDRSGRLIRELHSKTGLSTPLPREPLPPLVVQAFIAAEDRRFGSHLGIDPLAIGRALRQNLSARRIVSGASTIPQQLARQLVPRPRTLGGKMLEALWAIRLTLHLDRETLMRAYLDRIPLGRSAQGVATASEIYFNKPAASLSLAQAALLAGLARSPTTADPFTRPDEARARIASVLAHMRKQAFISAEEARQARTAPLDLSSPQKRFRAPHFVTQLAQRLTARHLDKAVELQTTLDLDLQLDLEAQVEETLAGLAISNVGQAAVLVLDNATGDVLAYVGSADFFDDGKLGQNDGVRSRRQPGSALKPFAYGMALARGDTPATILSDVETHLATEGGDYVPRNYDRRIHGPVRLRAALANSYNIPAIRIAERLGPGPVLETLHRAGFASLDEPAAHYGVGIILGNGDVTLWELARGYRGLALGGKVRSLNDLVRAVDRSGRELTVEPEFAARRFLPKTAVALLTDILMDEKSRAPAFGLDNALRLPFPTAAKTGTSRAHIDNWTVGFTKERTVAVWVGNFDGTPMKGVSGITGAAPLFKRSMLRAMRGISPAPMNTSVRLDRVPICPLSGEKATPACPSVILEAFLPGTAPTGDCPMHRLEGSGPSARLKLDLSPELAGWARGEGIEVGSMTTAEGLPRHVLFLSPRTDDVFLIDPGLPSDDQTIPVRALAPKGISQLELRFGNGEHLLLEPPFATRVPALRGEQRIELWVPGEAAPAAVARYTVR